MIQDSGEPTSLKGKENLASVRFFYDLRLFVVSRKLNLFVKVGRPCFHLLLVLLLKNLL